MTGAAAAVAQRSRTMTTSQCVVSGKRSTGIAETSWKGAPATLPLAGRQRKIAFFTKACEKSKQYVSDYTWACRAETMLWRQSGAHRQMARDINEAREGGTLAQSTQDLGV